MGYARVLSCSRRRGSVVDRLRTDRRCFSAEIGACRTLNRESLFFPRILRTLFIAVSISKWYKYLFLPEPEGSWRTELIVLRSRWLGLPKIVGSPYYGH